MRCERCGNQIKELFVKLNNVWVCRKCLVFKEGNSNNDKNFITGKGEYFLNYEITKFQKEASEFILNHVREKKDCILSAVTGAGKTEIIYPLIKYCIDNDLRICIAIPRKDVVIELFSRIVKDFKKASVVSVYGGCNKEIDGDVVVSTTHQLYRYNKYFDVIVIDEVDAFPFYNNPLLNHFLNRANKGAIVYMSATISESLKKIGHDIYYLNRRYNNEKLDIPKVKYLYSDFGILKQINKYQNGIVIVYFPTIKTQLKFSKKLRKKHYVINSKTKDRETLLKELHDSEKALVLSTLVLERGITFKNTNVIVVNADHKLFSFENLVQISGRVGRHYLYPHGDIMFFVKQKNEQVRKAIKFIKKCNE